MIPVVPSVPILHVFRTPTPASASEQSSSQFHSSSLSDDSVIEEARRGCNGLAGRTISADGAVERFRGHLPGREFSAGGASRGLFTIRIVENQTGRSEAALIRRLPPSDAAVALQREIRGFGQCSHVRRLLAVGTVLSLIAVLASTHLWGEPGPKRRKEPARQHRPSETRRRLDRPHRGAVAVALRRSPACLVSDGAGRNFDGSASEAAAASASRLVRAITWSSSTPRRTWRMAPDDGPDACQATREASWAPTISWPCGPSTRAPRSVQGFPAVRETVSRPQETGRRSIRPEPSISRTPCPRPSRASTARRIVSASFCSWAAARASPARWTPTCGPRCARTWSRTRSPFSAFRSALTSSLITCMVSPTVPAARSSARVNGDRNDKWLASLLDAVAQPILYDSEIKLPAEVAEAYPTKLPPLRADVPTLVVGKIAKPGARFDYT